MDLPRHSLAASASDSFRVGWGKAALATSSRVACIWSANTPTPAEESITVEENSVEIINTERTIFQLPGFKQYTSLMKLRIVVSLIFSLCTIAMIILIFVGDWAIAAVLLLIGYILLFILMIKLFITKKF